MGGSRASGGAAAKVQPLNRTPLSAPKSRPVWPPPPGTFVTDTSSGETPKMIPVTFLTRSGQPATSLSLSHPPDDHKFKKPMLPVKRRVTFIDDEKRRADDARKVQMYMQEATRKSQESNLFHRAPAHRIMDSPFMQLRSKPMTELVQDCTKEMSKIILHNEQVEVPTIFINSKVFFKAVVNRANFDSLSDESKEHLKKFLPPSETEEEIELSLSSAFTKNRYVVHGNPLETIQTRLKDGWFSPERCNDHLQLRDSRKVLYDHYIRFYYMNLLQKLAVNRHYILARCDTTSAYSIKENIPDKPLITPDALKKREQIRELRKRASKRTRMMLNDVKQMVGESGMSSDEDVEEAGPQIPKVLLSNNCQRSTLYCKNLKDLDMHQPTQIDDIKTMMKKYRRLKRKDPKAPCLQFDGIQLDDVFERAGILAQSEKIKQTVANLERELRG